MSLDSLVNILLIILGFGFLIGIHELGHFIAAKWAGIRANAFAIGMGPQVFSFRKGIGFCFKSTSSKVILKCGKDANNLTDAELLQFGISETEYSLRLLPIGGFVSMLGQEDGKPDEVSEDPRSYNKCSIIKRMVVVSAGVVMNLLLAGVLFLICFQFGVNFEAPVIGQIAPNSPAANARVVINDISYSFTPGDTVLEIDSQRIKTFQDVQIAGAMAKPKSALNIVVQRSGLSELLEFSVTPESSSDGLLELGLYPASSLALRNGNNAEQSLQVLKDQYSSLNNLKPGMVLNSVFQDGSWNEIYLWADFQLAIDSSENSLLTKWKNGLQDVEINLPVYPSLNILRPSGIPESAPQNFEYGYMGLSPLSKVNYVMESSPNNSVLEKGDVILKVGQLDAPRIGQLRNYLTLQNDGVIPVVVLRGGSQVAIEVTIKDGLLGVLLGAALDTPIFAQPIQEIVVESNGVIESVKTPVAGTHLLGGTYFESVGFLDDFTPVNNWRELCAILATLMNYGELDVEVKLKKSLSDSNQNSLIVFKNSTFDVARSNKLSNETPIFQQLFEPMYITRSSGGNPIKALQMGFDETVNMVVMTYLTIDRLFRRTVGVDQLRGPVGIIHIGSKIADRGISYLLFFLAIISVNLAVLNFLPLPIVDGGLFLYLVYEKIFKRPPSIAFQNFAAVIGLCLIGALFLVTFYNDIARLISGSA